MDADALSSFNALPAEAAEAALLACCAAPSWAGEVAAGRPYRSVAELTARAGGALAALDWAGIRQALRAHPRIGEQPAGTGREAAWSRREQAGVAHADDRTRAALAQANRDYEQRFGYLFLIFASGRSEREILAAATARLQHDPDTEQQVVRQELGKIVALRLERLVTP